MEGKFLTLASQIFPWKVMFLFPPSLESKRKVYSHRTPTVPTLNSSILNKKMLANYQRALAKEKLKAQKLVCFDLCTDV